ncbi:hypothetical protein Poli38472_000264 [Pythium oligandrum]|uniref:Uncharacterized protein n=1 Tax=Pythium oligandrum TaxID=41045 RepID=A0A8K1CDC9_PYTOL|nr:hypothetical protein Poli38472_000264 [Pythium oligandrum]|eukprot:TMW60222.1 hypothetical protein Poli38472_000264 [Pythium oligandrum]
MDAPTPVMRLYRDAQEDSMVALYSVLAVAPVSALVSRWLLRRGKQTTPTQVVIGSIIPPALLVGLPAIYWWFYGDLSVYRMLNIRRTESPHLWARKYGYWRGLYQSGQMPQDVWQAIDAAYDQIYDEKARFTYDFWGPEMKDMDFIETQCNVGLFYVLWGTIIYALTTPKVSARASKWAFSGLLAILGLDLSVRLLHYDPIRAKGILTFLTPRELVLWAHRLFPIFVFAIVSIKRVFYIDLDLHQQRWLRQMLEKNKVTEQTLEQVAKELEEEKEEETAETTN